ncbi:MAG: hypothetical protein IJ026_00785 [Candidatus Methanomethylophilaceae archaeon]|nr:hypothetical protein [Candidatus Methanomethylophilaceae archaeon]
MDREPLVTIIGDAARELHASFGSMTGSVISGRRIPVDRDVLTGEKLDNLVYRTMILPVMRHIGFDEESGNWPVLVTVGLNDRVGGSAPGLLELMRGSGAPLGVATDGFLWILAGNGRVRSIVDLRPLYEEGYENLRFGSAVRRPRSEIRWSFEGHGAET